MRFDSEWQGPPSPYSGRHRKGGLRLRLAQLFAAGKRADAPGTYDAADGLDNAGLGRRRGDLDPPGPAAPDLPLAAPVSVFASLV
ncbi:MAG TPA: hypothetical protein VEL03_07455 [Streptosporangiaceae bacterium]|nr:hypothetical protein [Streptosporangiaceae bacterium]